MPAPRPHYNTWPVGGLYAADTSTTEERSREYDDFSDNTNIFAELDKHFGKLLESSTSRNNWHGLQQTESFNQLPQTPIAFTISPEPMEGVEDDPMNAVTPKGKSAERLTIPLRSSSFTHSSILTPFQGDNILRLNVREPMIDVLYDRRPMSVIMYSKLTTNMFEPHDLLPVYRQIGNDIWWLLETSTRCSLPAHSALGIQHKMSAGEDAIQLQGGELVSVHCAFLSASDEDHKGEKLVGPLSSGEAILSLPWVKVGRKWPKCLAEYPPDGWGESDGDNGDLMWARSEACQVWIMSTEQMRSHSNLPDWDLMAASGGYGTVMSSEELFPPSGTDPLSLLRTMIS